MSKKDKINTDYKSIEYKSEISSAKSSIKSSKSVYYPKNYKILYDTFLKVVSNPLF